MQTSTKLDRCNPNVRKNAIKRHMISPALHWTVAAHPISSGIIKNVTYWWFQRLYWEYDSETHNTYSKRKYESNYSTSNMTAKWFAFDWWVMLMITTVLFVLKKVGPTCIRISYVFIHHKLWMYYLCSVCKLFRGNAIIMFMFCDPNDVQYTLNCRLF